MSHINDLKWRFYADELGTVPDISLPDMERAWLAGRGATGHSLADLWHDYLVRIEGMTGGHISDMKHAWLAGKGYSGTLGDMERAYYAS